MRKPMYSIWLMPEASSLKPWQSVHETLAARFGAPGFDLHLTLLGGLDIDPARLAPVLPKIVKGIVPFAATIHDIGTSDAYFQSFYALFAAQGPVLELKRRTMRLALGQNIGPFMPHVSLLYGPVEPAAKAAAASAMRARLKGVSLRFDAIALVLSSETVPIKDWQIVQSVSLGP